MPLLATWNVNFIIKLSGPVKNLLQIVFCLLLFGYNSMQRIIIGIF